MSITSQGRRPPEALERILLGAPADLFALGDALAEAVLGAENALASINLYDGVAARVELVGAAARDDMHVAEYRHYLETVAPDVRRRLHERILATGTPFVLDVRDEKLRLPSDRPLFLRREVRYHAMAPLRTPERVLGTLQVGRREPIGEDELDWLTDAGQWCGPAVATALLIRGLRRTEHITRVMSGNVGLEQLFAAVLPELRSLLDVDTVRLLLVEPGGAYLAGGYSLGANFDEGGERVPIGAGVAGRIAQDRVALVVEDVSHYPVHSHALRASGIASLAGVPIMDHEVLGVLHVGSYRARRFKTEDLELLALVADRLALAVRQSAVRAELRRSQAIAQSVLDTAADAILTFDGAGVVRSANRSVERLLGWMPREVLGEGIARLVPDCAELIAGRAARVPHDTLAVEAVSRDGRRVPVDLSVSEVEGAGNGRLFTAIVRDASVRRESEERLRQEAMHDPLTGLPNRALFLEHLDRSLARHDREHRQVAVMYLDLDNFKSVNDGFGHAAGDELLRQMASRLRLAVRPEDVLARLGGDEFAVLLEGIMPLDATAVANRILDRFRGPFSLEGRQVHVGTSIGIAHTLADPLTAAELLRSADAALYRAKGRGRSRFDVFDDGMRAWLEARLKLESELRVALARGELVVHYQPVCDLRSGRTQRLEALVRWNHPRRGVLSAGEFIDVARETGVMARLELEVVRQVAAQLERWEQELGAAAPHVSVNLSSARLNGPMEPLLDAAGARMSSLAFEVAEGALMGDPDRISARLDELRGQGAMIVLDDFGAGLCNPGLLRRLPLDAVKIARPLVAGLGASGDDRAVVHGLIGFAHALGLLVVGEGVERREQLEVLEQLGCDFAQGNLLGEPRPAEAVSVPQLEASRGAGANAHATSVSEAPSR